jgi:hypothetical protein
VTCRPYDCIDSYPHSLRRVGRISLALPEVSAAGSGALEEEFEQACQQRGLHLFVLPPLLPSSTGRWRACPAHPHRGVLPSHGLFAGR